MKEIYVELTDAAKKHQIFSHYTGLSALGKILENRSLLINRLDQVNDLYEDKYLNNFWRKKVYVACFTHRKSESFMYWTIYAMSKNNPGIMLSFPSELLQEKEIFGESQCQGYSLPEVTITDLEHKGYDCISDWGIFDITWADVKYTDDFTKYEDTNPMWENLKDCVNLCKEDFRVALYGGLLKGTAWDAEDETRICVAVRPKYLENDVHGVVRPTFEHLFLRLNDKTLDSCIITLNPWADKALEKKVRELLDNYKLSHIQINRSSLEGMVKGYGSWLAR